LTTFNKDKDDDDDDDDVNQATEQRCRCGPASLYIFLLYSHRLQNDL